MVNYDRYACWITWIARRRIDLPKLRLKVCVKHLQWKEIKHSMKNENKCNMSNDVIIMWVLAKLPTCSLPSPSQNWPYWNKICAKSWNFWKNNFSTFMFWDTVKILKIFWKMVNYFFVPEDPQCSETDAKLILIVVRFLFFEIQ